MVENEQFMLPGFMENVALSEAPSALQAVHTKKRSRLDMSLQKQFRADRVRDTTKQSELLMLKEALKSERDCLRKLHIELEEERGASMTAANEAMAMITRLQEEKAAVFVEARRYRLAAEERETHNQESIGLLKEALLTREDDLLALQELLGAYRETLMRLETEQGNYLENRGDSNQLLLLEGPNATPSCLDSNHAAMYYRHNKRIGFETGLPTTDYKHEESESQDKILDSQYSNGASQNVERIYEEATEGDSCTGGTVGRQGNIGSEYTCCEQLTIQSGDYRPVSENTNHSQEQALDDVSVSIFARVKRLEERFEFLRQNQALDYQRLSVDCQSDAVISANLKPEEGAETKWEETPIFRHNRNFRYCMGPEELTREDSANGDCREPEEVLKCLSFEKVKLDVRNQTQVQCEYHGGAGLGSECRQNKINVRRVYDERSTSFSEINDDESEGVHDVYEVQSEVKISARKDCFLEDNTEQQKFEADASMIGMLQEAVKNLVRVDAAAPGNYAQTEDCTADVSKLSIDVSPPDVKDVHANVADIDVLQLKVRLQALEGERDFMNEAIDSLRKENKELKVLQELAQQLRELNIDAKRNEVTGQQGQPPLSTFLKGVLSFTGFQSLASTKGNRCNMHSCSFSNGQRQDGLLHILDKGSESPKSPCVTRERKVKLSST